MNKKRIAALLAATVAVGTMPFASALLDGFPVTRTYSNQFIDVPTNAWYYNSVKTAYELGLTSGTSAATFSPNKSVNVDETTAFLARIHAAYNSNEITDQPGSHWANKYYDYVTDFIDSGYADDGLYGLAAESRWTFAYWLSKALPDYEYTEINDIPDGQIPDLPVNKYGYDVVNRIYMLYRAGILSGNDAYGTFSPNSDITRAEVTAIISRMIDPDQRRTFRLKDTPNSTEPSSTAGLTDAQVDLITQRLYGENELGTSIDMQGQILTRENWRNYQQAILDTLVDKIDFYGFQTVGSYLGSDPDTGVEIYQLTQAQLEQWMSLYYGTEIRSTPDNTTTYTVRGSQGFIDEDIHVYANRPLKDHTYYVQFKRINSATNDDAGLGYAVVHLQNGFCQIWELAWDTAEISPQAMNRYL